MNIIIDWLFASRRQINPQENEEAKEDWSRVFAPDPRDRPAVLQKASRLDRETLRLARVRLDLVSNLLVRASLSGIDLDTINV